MALFCLKIISWIVARLPEPLLHGFAIALGDLIFFCIRSRRRLVLSNLHHAFPERSREWQKKTGRESSRRLIETGLLAIATPYLSEARLRRIINVSSELQAVFATSRLVPAPTLMCSPHIAYWEAQTSMALALNNPLPEFGIIFRPLDNPAADDWVRRSRERFGMRLLSRREGFAEALKILRRKGVVGVLFDQNAGMQGTLTTLFGRVCSTSELPGLLAAKFDAHVFGLFPRRRGFWRVEVDAHRILCGPTAEEITLALNRWLEATLSTDDELCASWLWMHDRWRNQDVPARRLRLEAKRNSLAADLHARSQSALPQRTRVWVRLPNWLGDVVIAIPLLRALRQSRPDAEITVIAKPQFLPLLTALKLVARTRGLPPRGWGYFRHFWQLRSEYPDVYLLFTNSLRGDLEAWLTGCPQRFGLARPGHSRRLLTHTYSVPSDFDENTHHQLELWKNFFRHFGLDAPINRAPINLTPISRQYVFPIGLIAGSENSPEKRWPIEHWRKLIESLPEREFQLFGTTSDQTITASIAAGFDPERVQDFAGKTDLVAFADKLRRCRLLVTNDTGGMHLANMLGVPVIGLFGPTNPVRTGPVFNAPTRILQPAGCPPGGGGDLSQLSPEIVVAEVNLLLAAPPVRV